MLVQFLDVAVGYDIHLFDSAVFQELLDDLPGEPHC